ncbi:MAG: nitrite/sulfite reductase [Chloroflexi bacterium]|nr:nitrite/sulfite reductase [Chloroflexota bacterium]
MSAAPTSETMARDEVVRMAVRNLAGELLRVRQGTLTNDEFRPTRTILGVYGQRQPEQYMVRIRLPYGSVTPGQLRAIAAVARTHGYAVGHVTTRQDVQLPWLSLDDMPRILEQLHQAGLITLQSGGNSVRNVAACPLAGVCPQEAFDVSGHAAAVDDFYVGNPAVMSLPRKFKSSFSGCAADCALSAIQDFGAIAVQSAGEEPRRGFRVYAGGGLGSMPRRAAQIDDFVPEEELLPTYEAVLRVFARLGDRTRKDRARLKFVVARLGEAEFRRIVLEERAAVKLEGILSSPAGLSVQEAATPSAAEGLPQASGGYGRWLRWNVQPERRSGSFSVSVGLPLGDITSDQMEAVAALAERQPRVTLRTSAQQNLILRGLSEDDLPVAYEALNGVSLAGLRANGVADVTSCPGTSACSLGIAASKGLAQELQRVLIGGGYQDDEAVARLRIKTSGCPDACGQHQLADIGFFGAALHRDGRLYPGQVLHLGGSVGPQGTRLGRPVMKLPARRAPEAVERLLAFYKAERRDGEGFGEFVDRKGDRAFRELLEDLTRIPPAEEDPSNFIDWDSTRLYILERGEGECAV